MLKRNIPNAITCGNLLCGCLAIVKCFEGDLAWASYLVGIAAVLDFFDGFAARMLKVSSPIGKDLDSLADMITFGVVPGIMMFQLFNISNYIYLRDTVGPRDLHQAVFNEPYYIAYIAFLIPLFSAIRLAKFNNDTRQSESFIGMPTPANAILICSIPLFVNTNPHALVCFRDFNIDTYILNPAVLILASVILSILLVAPLPLFALKFKNFKWKGNEIRFSFLIWTVLLLAFFQLIGIPLIIISYLLFSLVNNLIKAKQA